MGRVIARKMRGMNFWIKIGLITTLTLLLSVFMHQGWYTPQVASAVAARVQSSTGRTGSSAATSITMTSLSTAPVNGNTLVAIISTRGTVANRVSGIDQTGVIWTKVTEGTNAGGTTTEIWYAPNIVDAGSDITINLTASLYAAAVVAEYRGMLTAGVLDVSSNAMNGTSNTTASTGTTSTTSQADELWIGGISLVNSSYTLTGITNSFTTIANVATSSFTTSNNTELYALERIATATGAATTGGTISTSSRWSGAIATFKATPPNNLTISNGINPVDASAYQNSTDNAINSFTMVMSDRAGTVSTLTLTNTNSAATTVSDIHIYRDNGSIGTLDGTDVLVPATLSGQTATAATITFSTPEPVGTTVQNYLVVVDIAGSATVASTITSRITAANGDEDGESYSDAGSATLTVATGTLTVGDGTNPTNNASAYKGNEYGIDGFTMAVSAGVGKISTLTLTTTNLSSTNVSGISVYRDNGAIGTFEPAVDTLVPTTYVINLSTQGTITFTTPETVGTTAQKYLIVYEIGSGSTNGTTLTARVTAATGTGDGTPVYSDASCATLTIAANNLTIATGTNPSSVSAYRGYTYAINGFNLDMSAASGTVSTLTLTNTNSTATNVADIAIYRDAGTVGTLDGSDTLVPSSYVINTANAATITFSTPEPVTTAGQNYLIVYTIGDAATVGTTLTSRVSGATGYVGIPTSSDASATLTIAQGNLTIGAGTAIAGVNVPQGTTSRSIDSCSMVMSAGTAKVNSLTLTTSAQFTAANIANIRVYNDAAAVGTFDGADGLIPSAFTIGSSTATVTLDTPENLSTSAKNYFIVIDVAPLAAIGNTLSARVTAASGVGLGTTTNNNITSTTHTVSAGICVRSTPIVMLDTYGQAKAGETKRYDLTITNNDNMYCTSSSFGIAVGSETGATASFTLPSSLAASTTGALNAASSFTTTLTVSSKATAATADVLTSTINVTDPTNHASQSWSGSVKTYSNDPMLHNSISFNPTATKWGANGWGIPGGQYGAFSCTTCHVPGSSNISRIKVALTAPSGSFPGSTVLFQSKKTINDAGNPSFGVYSTTITNSTRICEVCHSQTNYHKRNQSAPVIGHENQAKLADCIECHKHDQGFKPIGGCTVCHKYVQRNKRNSVMSQFSSGNSHHIQGVAVTDKLCYQCHWEANSDGTVNTTYHGGSLNTGAAVDLVIYQNGARPTTKDATTAIAYNADGSRTEMTKLNNHCLSCHNAANGSAQPFSDGKTPKKYAWDGKSIDERYSQTGKVAWGQYNTNNVTPKFNQQKSFSAHGNASANQRGWNLNETWPNTSGSVKVLCFDCHNSHGSAVSGVTSNYSSATGRNHGALLKEVKVNVGGYSTTYKPASGGSVATKDVYNPGAGLCFDCHNSQNAGTTPWGWQDTYGATQAISGYWDTARFSSGTFPSTQRYTYKGMKSGGNMGGHFGASSSLDNPPDAQHQIKGLCTPCHDPHGVSPTINQAYSVPLLKGTWMTSPYKEDVAPAATNEVRGGSDIDSSGDSGGSSNRPSRQRVGSTPRYNIDQTTFGASGTTSQNNYGTPQTAPNWNLADATRITETDAQFAGLCINCHPKNLLAPKAGATAPDPWKTRSRIHNTVKGWATTAGSGNANNTIHSYTCSKCHTPHNYRLPRLMITNCLDYTHRGSVASGGTVQATAGNASGANGTANPVGSGHHVIVGDNGSGKGRFPAGGGRYSGSRSEAQNPGEWFFGTNGSSFNACHDNANTVDSAYPAKQRWNTKTVW